MINNLKIAFLFNGQRGLQIVRYFKKKKINNFKIFLAKKNLQKKILNIFKREKIINNLNDRDMTSYLKKSDFAILGGFPYILPKKIIKFTKYGIINCHAGLLPQYRGGSPLNWQIINNEKKFGISTMLINEKIDSGEIICEKKFILKKSYDINDLHKIVNNEFPPLVERSIKKIIRGDFLKKQRFSKSYFKQRSEKDSLLNFKSKSFQEIKNFVRALQKPYPNPYIYYKNKRISFNKVKKSRFKLKAGHILQKNRSLFIGCKDCTLKIR